MVNTMSPMVGRGMGSFQGKGTELKYSPKTPAYDIGLGGKRQARTPISSNHMRSQSPMYSYGENTPKVGLEMGYVDSSPLGSDPEKLMKHVYNPESPSYRKEAELVDRNEDYSEEEEEKA